MAVIAQTSIRTIITIVMLLIIVSAYLQQLWNAFTVNDKGLVYILYKIKILKTQPKLTVLYNDEKDYIVLHQLSPTKYIYMAHIQVKNVYMK